MKTSTSVICRLVLMLLGSAGWALFEPCCPGQETNAPKTILEAFEAQNGVILVKGSVLIGTVSGQPGLVSVKCKESRDARSGRKESGLAIEVRESEALADTTLVDQDEVESFLVAIDYISTSDFKVTPLPNFDVVYMTKGGLKISTYSSKKEPGTIQVALQSNRLTKTRVSLSASDLAQFQSLIQQAKAKLEALRATK